MGEAGQFCLPDGEWFCVQCTSASAMIDEQIVFAETNNVNEAASTKPSVESQYLTHGRDEERIGIVQSNSSSVCAVGEGESST